MKKTITLLTLLWVFAFNSQAAAYDEANWYLSVDVAQIRDKVLPLLPQEKHHKNDFSLRENMPQEVQKITLYGHTEKENDVSVVLAGQFANFSLNQYITDTLYQINGESPIALYDSTAHGGTVINQFKVDEKKANDFAFYSAKLNDQMMVISFSQTEVKNWIDGQYSTADLYQSDLISLLVNVESAMAKMGADLSAHKQPFQSEMFTKVTQVSAAAYESGADLSLDLVLSTSDDATATQLVQVARGLVAMNALSGATDEKPVLTTLLNGLNISQQGTDLLVTTSVPFSLLPQINVD
ncbi:hypothetical protein [Marinicella meishanensis]|uniref:hypothetical protein n=1 Tax=Marinicella meishanensis TaxID=2873263 RepID=UPI001CBEF194|nr:hypothetical protein [Marinicella sp. NBU2979]